MYVHVDDEVDLLARYASRTLYTKVRQFEQQSKDSNRNVLMSICIFSCLYCFNKLIPNLKQTLNQFSNLKTLLIGILKLVS